MTETVLDTGSLKVTAEAILFRSGPNGEADQGRIPVAAITRVTKKKLLLPFFWPVLATLSAELSLVFLALSYANPLTRKPLADFVIGLGQQQGLETAALFQRYYDDHHLFLISMAFLALALLPVLCAVLLRQNRLVLKLATPNKPAVGVLVIKAGRNLEALQDAITRAIGVGQGKIG